MPKDAFRFNCPCCGKRIEVNVRSGRARAVKPSEAGGGQDLDTLIDKQKGESTRLGDVFSDALDQQKSDSQRLEDLLRKAKEEAKHDDDERPPSIWDRD